MARIRSTHSEQWTDEDFVQCSPLARLLALGIRNHADDNGIFEWKPITLKMKILPADNIDVADLLAELEGTNQVHKYTIGGKEYGLIRNFTKFQKPKKPSFLYPTPDKLPDSYELHKQYPPSVQDQFPTDSEPLPKLTFRGEKRREEESKYRFAGTVIRLKEEDYREMKKTYHAIPDFDAELKAADTQYSKEPPGNWFCALGNRLNGKHQNMLKACQTNGTGRPKREVKAGAINLINPI